MAEWLAQPRWRHAADGPNELDCGAGYGARGGQALMDYVVPGGAAGVVLSRHLDKASMPLPMARPVVERLVAGGISRLIIGHTPHGNCALPARRPRRTAPSPSCVAPYRER